MPLGVWYFTLYGKKKGKTAKKNSTKVLNVFIDLDVVTAVSGSRCLEFYVWFVDHQISRFAENTGFLAWGGISFYCTVRGDLSRRKWDDFARRFHMLNWVDN